MPDAESPTLAEGRPLLAAAYRNIGRHHVADALAGEYNLSEIEKIAARALVRARDANDAKRDLAEVTQTLARIVDGLLPELKRKAHTEAKAEAGKPMRKITWQRRLEGAERSLEMAAGLLEREP